MKSNLFAKLSIVFCLCLITVFVFASCKEKEVYANNSDFESYPEYWNSFNEDTTGDVYVPDTDDSSKGNVSSTSSEQSSSDPDFGDYEANFEEDEDEESGDTSSSDDTDADGLPDNTDPDDDNDGITDNDEIIYQAPPYMF